MNEKYRLMLLAFGEAVIELTADLAIFAIYTWCGQILWNSTVTEVFGASPLTYWQMLSLLSLLSVTVGFLTRYNDFGKSKEK